MSADTNVADVRAFIERAWNQGDTLAFDEFLSPDFVGGRERFKGMILGFRSAFPDLKQRIPDDTALERTAALSRGRAPRATPSDSSGICC
jgi:hypothetical protein